VSKITIALSTRIANLCRKKQDIWEKNEILKNNFFKLKYLKILLIQHVSIVKFKAAGGREGISTV